MKPDFWKHKRVLVTGHTGFAGTWLCKVLDMAGAHVAGYGLEPDTTPSFYHICRMERKVKSNTGDIRNYDALKETFEEFRPEIVFHLAFQPQVSEGYENPAYTFDVNAMGTVSVLECVRNCRGVKSVVIGSSDKAYYEHEQAFSYPEGGELKGKDPYSNSMSCAELAAYSYAETFFKNTDTALGTLRCPELIGGGDFARGRLIADCVRAAQDKKEIKIKNPDVIRPYMHVLEAVNALMLLAMAQYKDKTLAGAYNAAPPDSGDYTASGLVNVFCETWRRYTNQRPVCSCALAYTPMEPSFIKMDCSKIKRVLGFEEKWDIEKAMDKTVQWYVEYGKEKDVNMFMEKQIKEYFR